RMDVQSWPTDMPKFSVIRLEISPEKSHAVAGGKSPVLDHETVGSDNSSATQGSSVASVAGKKRAPTKQWAKASVLNAAATPASARVGSKCRDMRISPVRKRERKFGRPTWAGLHHALSGGPLGRAAEYGDAEGRRSARPD